MDDLISRRAAIDTAKDWYEGLICGSVNGLIKRLNALPTVQPEQCGDKSYTLWKESYEELKRRMDELTSCSDIISRQAAIDAIVQCTNCGDEDTLREYVLKHSLDNGWTGGILEALDAVKNLPTAQPEPQEGEWEQVSAQRYFMSASYFYRCSACGVNNVRNTNYCPKCGAKMKGAKHETD